MNDSMVARRGALTSHTSIFVGLIFTPTSGGLDFAYFSIVWKDFLQVFTRELHWWPTATPCMHLILSSCYFRYFNFLTFLYHFLLVFLFKHNQSSSITASHYTNVRYMFVYATNKHGTKYAASKILLNTVH